MSDCEPLNKRQKLQKSDFCQSNVCESRRSTGVNQTSDSMRNSRVKGEQKSLEKWILKKANMIQTEPEESEKRSETSASVLRSDEDSSGKKNKITDFFSRNFIVLFFGFGLLHLAVNLRELWMMMMMWRVRRCLMLRAFWRSLVTTASLLTGKSDSRHVTWLGVPLDELQRAPACSSALPRLKPSDTHTLMIRTDLLHPGMVPVPYPCPEKALDCWDTEHVKMPCSKHNLFPGHNSTLESRWVLINQALRTPFSSCEDLKSAILKYNAAQAKNWDFTALTLYCKGLQKGEYEQMFGDLIPAMVQLALRLDRLCTQPISLLHSQKCGSVTLSQEQVSSLLANAFFCTFPRRNSRRTEFSNYPDINFNRLFEGSSQKKQEKLKTLLWYFRRITQQRPTGVVTFTRRCVQSFPSWCSSKQTLGKLHITCDGTIEEQGHGLLQVDFANRFVGGGVTGSGLVQEEIRFLINPELIAARLFTEALDDNECLVITGTEQFSSYSGYSDTYRWDGNHDDQTPRDEWQRRHTEIVAIDALHYRNFVQQFHPDNMKRELNKAYCGFARPEMIPKHLSAVATGNWGCGAFGGDTRLKAVLQMMAAAEARRDLIYFTFGDTELLRDVHNIHTLFTQKNITVGSVFRGLQKYYECACLPLSSTKVQKSLYSFLSENL